MTSHIPAAKAPLLLKIFVLATMLLGFAVSPMASRAQDNPAPADAATAAPVTPDPNAVLAVVNGEAITEADLAFVQEDIGAQLQQVPPDEVRAVLLAQLINLKLMAKAGADLGLQDSDVFKKRVQYLTERAISRAYALQEVAAKVTDEAIQAEYDKVIGSAPDIEIHLLHILVTTEEDAKAIKAALDAGGDFAALAADKSIDPSAKQNGGDLGFVPYWQVVKPFADAAFALKDGETSGPVQSQFGWHIIRAIDRHPATKPTIGELAPQIGQRLYSETYQAVFDSLKSAATIEISDPALKAQVDAQLGQ
ncbi:MAG: peptidylprolyl isomerase [Devosia sp.]